MIEIREPAHVSQQPFEVDIAGTRFPGSMTRGAAFDPEGSLMRLAHSDNGWQGAGARHDRPELGLQNTNT